MSSSDLYVLNQHSTTWLASFRNGWGSAPAAWGWLGAKYVPDKPVYTMDREYNRKVWDLTGDPRLTLDEKIVLMFTFDGVYVPLQHVKDVGEACISFYEKSYDGERANNWGDIGQFLLSIAGKKFNRFARGVCLSCTSVSDPWSDWNSDTPQKTWSMFSEAPTP